MLHGCAEARNFNWNNPDVLRENDADCLRLIDDHYQITDAIGHGVSGTVVKVVSKTGKKVFAIKIVERTETTLKEIYMACLVDTEIAAKQPVFSRTYGWIACGMPPESWNRVLDDYFNREHGYIPKTLRQHSFYLVSELGGSDLQRIIFQTVRECKSVVFELAYAIHWAFTAHRFVHGDLHRKNVVLRFGTIARHYTVDNKHFTISHSEQPQIIDFDQSTLGSAYETRDIGTLLSSLTRNTYPEHVDDFLRHDLIAAYKASRNLKEFLLHPIFEDFQTAKPQLINSRCHVCHGNVTQCVPYAPSFQYCDLETCINVMGPLGKIVKRE